MFKKSLFLIGTFLLAASVLEAQVRLDQCVRLAQENYPLIKKHDLLRRTQAVSLSDIRKSWLPQVGAYAQGTVQNAVPSFPDELSDVLSQAGASLSGLGKWQYKAGVDLAQTIWDGGASKSQQAVVRAEQYEQQASLAVREYAVRERVENLFFSALLVDEQVRQTQTALTLLRRNLERLRSMLANGTAMQSDVDMVEAQLLAMSQQLVAAQSNAQACRRMLSLFTGMDMAGQELEKPKPEKPENMTVNRPELSFFEARIRANEARAGSIKSGIMPRVGLFAQAYYGYPGFDYFKSMRNRLASFNLLAGVKVSWNIASLYTKKNSERKLQLSSEHAKADRDVFLFDTQLQTASQNSRIVELEKIMAEDGRIVELRANVRRAAEVQLDNGVIDATALLTKITDENQARLTAAYHEVQLIQSIYQLKYTLNR